MNNSDQSITDRIAAAGERVDAPEIDLLDVSRRVARRRRSQVAGLLTASAIVILAMAGGVHLASSRGGGVPVADPPIASRSANTKLGAGPGCAPPNVDFSGTIGSGARKVSIAHPLRFVASIKDTEQAGLLDGSLFLGKTGLALQARLANGDPSVTRAANQQARADSHKVAGGEWAANLKVTSLPSGLYPLIFFGHYRYLSADCTARGGTETYSDFTPIGVVRVN